MTAFMGALRAAHGAAPDPPCGGFGIEAVAEDGTRRKVPLASATRIPFADVQPSRRFRARKGQQNLPGRWWSYALATVLCSRDSPVRAGVLQVAWHMPGWRDRASA